MESYILAAGRVKDLWRKEKQILALFIVCVFSTEVKYYKIK